MDKVTPENLDNEFLKIKKADNKGKPYYYAERKGTDSVAFILLDKSKPNNKVIGLVKEYKPPICMSMTTAFGGSLDKIGKTPLDIVIDEVREEAGYRVNPNQVQYLGRYFVSTQMNQMCALYMVTVSDKNFIGKTTDDETEKQAEVKWLDIDEIMLGSDWKAITALHKAMYLIQTGAWQG